MSETEPRHWMFAVATALVVHLVVALLWLWEAESSGARAVGVAGIEVSMGPAGGAPGAEVVSEAEPAEVEAVEPAEVQAEDVPAERPRTAEAVPREANPVEAEAVEPADVQVEDVPAEPVRAAEAVPVDENPVELEAVEAEAVEAEAVEAAQAEPKPAEEEPVELEPAEPKAAKAEPVDVQESETAGPVDRVEAMPKPTKAPPEPAQESPEEEVAAKPEASAPGAGGKAGTTEAPDAGSSSNDTSAGGAPGPSPDYLAKLQAWLERHKEYPRRAQLRRQEGTVILFFVMNADGQVLEHRIQRSSGHDALDREVVAMIKRAQPLPRMPEHMRESRLELAVPVQFYLR